MIKKHIQTLCLLVGIFAMQAVHAQGKRYLSDFRIDSIAMNKQVNYADYFPNCEVAHEKVFWRKSDNQCAKWVASMCYPVAIINWENVSIGTTHTHLILILSSEYRLFYKNQDFFVGMPIEKVGKIFSELLDRNGNVKSLSVPIWVKSKNGYEDVEIFGLRFEVSQEKVSQIVIMLSSEDDLENLFEQWESESTDADLRFLLPNPNLLNIGF